MAKHTLELAWRVTFDDGSPTGYNKIITIPDRGLYCFRQQKGKYLVRWLEHLIKKENITDKPIRIEEFYRVVECEEYQNRIGL